MKGMNDFDEYRNLWQPGAMGKVINNIISTRDDSKVVAGIDKYGEGTTDFPVVATPNLLSSLSIEPDVMIDFSHPSVLDGLLDYCITNRVALVIADNWL